MGINSKDKQHRLRVIRDGSMEREKIVEVWIRVVEHQRLYRTQWKEAQKTSFPTKKNPSIC